MKIITALELKNRMEQEKLLLIDVRDPLEYKVGHIQGSKLIPLCELCIEKLPSTTGPIVIYCVIGRRSAQACEKLLKMDQTLDVYSLEGGINSWKKANFSVETLATTIMSTIHS